jgi:hypothetical protein
MGETAVKVALGWIPVVGSTMATAYADTVARRRQNAAKTGSALLERYPGTPEEVLDRISEDERLGILFGRSVEAAMRTSLEAKVMALGYLLADFASSQTDDEADGLELLLMALDDLEWPHIRALKTLADFPSDADLEAEVGQKAMNDDPRRKGRLKVTDGLSRPVLSGLVRHGLIREESGYGTYISGITEQGRALLGYLKDAEPRSLPTQ